MNAVDVVPLPPPPPTAEQLREQLSGHNARSLTSPHESAVLAKFRKAIRDAAHDVFGAFYRHGSCADDIAQDIAIQVVRMARNWQARGRTDAPPDRMVWATIRNTKNKWRRDANRSLGHTAAVQRAEQPEDTYGRSRVVDVNSDAAAGSSRISISHGVGQPDSGDNRRAALVVLTYLREIDEAGVIAKIEEGGKITYATRRDLERLRTKARAAGIVPD